MSKTAENLMAGVGGVLLLVIPAIGLVMYSKWEDNINKEKYARTQETMNLIADFSVVFTRLDDATKASYPCEEVFAEKNKRICEEYKQLAIERLQKQQ